MFMKCGCEIVPLEIQFRAVESPNHKGKFVSVVSSDLQKEKTSRPSQSPTSFPSKHCKEERAGQLVFIVSGIFSLFALQCG
ncbi:hypothetical protein MRB53_032302 [Persea americana]|uniref:Uncharacterized protein n=1 Tax=Persea americana TaxID=3435 RepID=A0ACC2KRJ1_PERAE|nr:hypothetical protein MRB53_032302 [Persea americana]